MRPLQGTYSSAAAIAAPMIWIGLTGEFGAARGGAVNLGITAAGAAVYFFILYRRVRASFALFTVVLLAEARPWQVGSAG